MITEEIARVLRKSESRETHPNQKWEQFKEFKWAFGYENQILYILFENFKMLKSKLFFGHIFLQRKFLNVLLKMV